MDELKRLLIKGAAVILLASGGSVFISQQGEQFVKQKEGLRLRAYKDEAGVWTNGWGNTKNVVPGSTITMAQAQADFDGHMRVFVDSVLKSLSPIDLLWQGQLDAYVSLTHNIGGGAFRNSSVAKLHKAGNYPDAALAILRWDKLTDAKTKKKRPSKGLAKRRFQEYNMAIQSIPPAYWNYSRDRTRP